MTSSGTQLVLSGRPVIYFASGEPLDPAHFGDVQGFDHFEDRDLAAHPRLRRTLTTLIRPTPRFYGVLHWSDGTDLDVLDELVRSGDATDSEFDGALPAELGTIVCGSCEAHLRVLQVDPGNILFADTFAERLRKHTFQQTCPVCGNHLPLYIVEFLGVDATS